MATFTSPISGGTIVKITPIDVKRLQPLVFLLDAINREWSEEDALFFIIILFSLIFTSTSISEVGKGELLYQVLWNPILRGNCPWKCGQAGYAINLCFAPWSKGSSATCSLSFDLRFRPNPFHFYLTGGAHPFTQLSCVLLQMPDVIKL